MHPIIYAKRDAIEENLVVYEGNLPNDIFGIVYLISPVGSVNSGGLPIPAKKLNGLNNEEFGSPLMNGDGMVIKIDFNVSHVATVKTALLKPPCYFADEATKENSTLSRNKAYKKYKFKNMGIARMSPFLGIRNALNTAFVPFQFEKDSNPRIMATYDAGRPYEFSVDKLKIKTPIGTNNEWIPSTPSSMPSVFTPIQSTAHPVFDPYTFEFFTVNYTRSLKTMFHLKLELPPQNYLRRFVEKVTQLKDEVFLLRWNGKQEPLKKWKLVDDKGNNLVIRQCMHQICITKDYIILSDSSYKVTLNTLFTNPKKRKIGTQLIKRYTTRPMLPYLTLYLVKRADLTDDSDAVQVKTLAEPIPIESVHFAANYSNLNDKITLYLSHNSAACMAEWIRPNDTLAINPKKKIDQDLVGMFAIGAMDIGRIGKFVINAKKAEIIEEETKILHKTGNLHDIQHIGAHTWELGLYTYRGCCSHDSIPNEIKDMYFVSYGLDSRMLTNFIKKLYYNYPNRIIAQKDILKYTAQNLPSCLIRLNTETMEIDDHWQFPFDYNMRSIQFIPSKNSQENDTKKGYILCSMVNIVQPKIYQTALWIFKADALYEGPICKLKNDNLTYAFTLHSAWLPKAIDTPTEYNIDVVQDYNTILENNPKLSKNKRLRIFLNRYVYSHFEKENCT